MPPVPTVAGVALDRPRLMGIVNVTPDSFSDGGRGPEAAAAHGRRLAEEGADFLDVGGESTRPGSEGTPTEEQLARVLPVIEALAPLGVPISIDTRSAAVMRAAIEAGAAIVNDVAALDHDPAAAPTVAALGVPVILTHARGEPARMRERADYADVAAEVRDELGAAVVRAEAAGIARANILLDPGFGFAKKPEQNAAALRALPVLSALGLPIVAGTSRKSFVRGKTPPQERLGASIAAALAAVEGGAAILRVHDIAATAQALAVWAAVRGIASA